MQPFNSDDCPQPTLLVEFLQGKLEPPSLGECEAHLEKCARCHETLRGLDTGDTFSEKVADALISDQPTDDPDSQHIDGLVKKFTADEFKTRNSSANHAAASEIMADRAAEVLRCVQPDEKTLGVLGDYALLRLIGSGSTGVVFQALDQKLNRTVALKVLRPSLGVLARERFLAEAQSAASIDHPNVVTIFQVGQVDRLAFIAMQWSPGQTLETKLQSGVSFDEHQVTDIVLKVAKGLAAAHQKQIVHRDIKPANLWVCDAGDQIKILDFGLARINDDNPGLTATGMLAGTPNFMSPEQARGLELDGRSDLFSLGGLMYQLLTGRLPFGAPTVLATLQSVQNESPTPPHEFKPDVPQDLSDLTMCLLEKQPANRPESAPQLIEMLSTTRQDWPVAVSRYVVNAEERSPVAAAGVGAQRRSGGGRWWLVTGLLLGLAGWAAWLGAPQILRVMTDQGEIVIESNVDDVEVQVFADGKLIRVVDTQTQQSFDLKSGKYTFAARSSGDGANTFAISPGQLTMSRGSTQIVKVTTVNHAEPPSATGEALVSTAKSPLRLTDKPIFKNQPFEYWLRVARQDRDVATKTDALQACAATAETDNEIKTMVQLTRQLCRKQGGNVIGVDSDKDRYHAAMRKVVNSLETDRIVKFIETEITDGTVASRRFCSGWLTGVTDGVIPQEWLAKIDLVLKAGPIQEALARHLEEPGNYLMLEPVAFSLPLEDLKDSELLKAVKQSAFKLDQRLLMRTSIIVLLGDDPEVFQLFCNDLLDPKADPEKRLAIFSHLPGIHNHPLPLNQSWMQLLLDVGDGVLRNGDQRLVFLWKSNFGGDFGIDRRVKAEQTLADVLLLLYRHGDQMEAKFKTETMLPRLQKLKTAIERAVQDPAWKDDFVGGNTEKLLADLHYLIEIASGDSDAEIPPGGFLDRGGYFSSEGFFGGGGVF